MREQRGCMELYLWTGDETDEGDPIAIGICYQCPDQE